MGGDRRGAWNRCRPFHGQLQSCVFPPVFVMLPARSISHRSSGMLAMRCRFAIVRRVGLLVVLVAGAGAIAGQRMASAADLFPDKNLEAVVRQYVFAKRDNNQPLVEADVQNISTIVGRKRGIKDLRGLEKCVSLALLDLAENEIVDLAPIKDLGEIQSLTLFKNKIADVKPIAGLKKLQYLQLSHNQISDLGPLAQLTEMRSLYLDYNQIKDLGPVANMKKAWSLYVRGNKVSDLKPVSGLKWLSSLDLRNNEVSDLSPIAGLTELRYLMLDRNKIADLAVLVKMAQTDAAGPKRFAPFWRIFLHGNPLGEPTKGQIEELKKHGGRVYLDDADEVGRKGLASS